MAPEREPGRESITLKLYWKGTPQHNTLSMMQKLQGLPDESPIRGPQGKEESMIKVTRPEDATHLMFLAYYEIGVEEGQFAYQLCGQPETNNPKENPAFFIATSDTLTPDKIQKQLEKQIGELAKQSIFFRYAQKG